MEALIISERNEQKLSAQLIKKKYSLRIPFKKTGLQVQLETYLMVKKISCQHLQDRFTNDKSIFFIKESKLRVEA